MLCSRSSGSLKASEIELSTKGTVVGLKLNFLNL